MTDDPRFEVRLTVRPSGTILTINIEDWELQNLEPGEHPIEAVRRTLAGYRSMADLLTQEGLTEDLAVVVQVYDGDGQAEETVIDAEVLRQAWVQQVERERGRQSYIRDVQTRDDLL